MPGEVEEPRSGMSRRAFLAGACASAATFASGLASCAEPLRSSSPPLPLPSARADAVCQADLLVVGAGGSGLACAVQAALNGLDVILVEKGDDAGGNARFVKGMFAVNSTMQRERGIDILPAAVIEAELARGQHRLNGDLWLEFVNRSAENITWCIEQGVAFSGEIDDCFRGRFPTFHRFGDGSAAAGYVEPMKSRLDELGVSLHLETVVTDLVVEDGAVIGAHAERAGGVVRYEVGAVVLATGGFGGDPALVREQGWRAGAIRVMGSPNASGDGMRLARSVGAGDVLAESAQSILYAIDALSSSDSRDAAFDALVGPYGIAAGGPVLWVNEQCCRYAREDVARDSLFLQCIPGKGNEGNFAVFDRAILERFYDADGRARTLVDAAIDASDGGSLRRGETLANLCGAFGLDPVALAGTLARYNELCRAGVDEDFGKAAGFMAPIETPPFYMAKLSYDYFFSVGGIATDKRFRVLDADRRPIAGLYAVGNDGSMLHRSVYATAVSGAAFGNQVHSGRGAAFAAREYLSA